MRCSRELIENILRCGHSSTRHLGQVLDRVVVIATISPLSQHVKPRCKLMFLSRTIVLANKGMILRAACGNKILMVTGKIASMAEGCVVGSTGRASERCLCVDSAGGVSLEKSSQIQVFSPVERHVSLTLVVRNP